MADTIRPNFCEGEDGNQLMAETASLLKLKWTLDDTQQGLEKTFNFPTYAKALDFILLVGVETKLYNHHPSLRNSYKSVSYHWTTHKPQGLSSKDIHMARVCEDKAKLLGHINASEGEPSTSGSAT